MIDYFQSNYNYIRFLKKKYHYCSNTTTIEWCVIIMGKIITKTMTKCVYWVFIILSLTDKAGLCILQNMIHLFEVSPRCGHCTSLY